MQINEQLQPRTCTSLCALAPLREISAGFPRATWHLAPFAIFLCGFIVGCGAGSGPARYEISGKVTFQGQPVEKGQITFEDPAAGQVNESSLGSGGSYTTKLPAGDFRVSVSPPLIQTKGTGDSPPDQIPDPAVKNIPKKYWRQESSGLSAPVAKDKRTFDFDLKP